MGLLVNLGCGSDIRDGWVNIDREILPGIDFVRDLEDADLPFDDNSVERYIAIDLIEHVTNVLGLFQELYRCAEPGGVIEAALPYGSSDDAWTDPTHVRPWFVDSWAYLAQPTYFRLDYGYTADWKVERIVLDVEDTDEDDDEIFDRIVHERNIVQRQYVALSAVKPARPRDITLAGGPQVAIRRVADDGE